MITDPPGALMQSTVEFYLFFRNLDHSYQQIDVLICFLGKRQSSCNTETFFLNPLGDCCDRSFRVSHTQNVTHSGSLGGQTGPDVDFREAAGRF